jgi:hypothetical protein
MCNDVTQLLAALLPFANAAKEINAPVKDYERITVLPRLNLTIGDLRKAEQIYDQIRGLDLQENGK